MNPKEQQAQLQAMQDAITINTVILSFLMPTIPERRERFDKLFAEVSHQVRYCKKVHPTLGVVEIIVDDGEKFTKGGKTIGGKRQALIEEANGRYCCFLDDDEEISPDYVETLLRLCRGNKDVCTFQNISKFDNYWCIVNMSISHPINEQAKPGIIKRKPWHICPVRTELAKRAKFPESNYGEDWVWFEQIIPFLGSEEHTDAIIHSYIHSLKVSQSDNVTTSVG